MSAQKRIMIPHNATGQLIFDVFHSVADKMLLVGNEAIGDYAIMNYPNSKAIGKEYSDGKLRLILQSPSGERIAVEYDYTKQTTTAAHLPHREPALNAV